MKKAGRSGKLLIQRKVDGSHIYRNVFNLKSWEMSSEKSLMKLINERVGPGFYVIQAISEEEKGFSQALWKGRIKSKRIQGHMYTNLEKFKQANHTEDL